LGSGEPNVRHGIAGIGFRFGRNQIAQLRPTVKVVQHEVGSFRDTKCQERCLAERRGAGYWLARRFGWFFQSKQGWLADWFGCRTLWIRSLLRNEWPQLTEGRIFRLVWNYFSLAYSAFACLRIGISGSASFPEVPVGKETDRRWHDSTDMSIFDFEIEQFREKTGLVLADASLLTDASTFSKRQLIRSAKLSQKAVYAILEGKRVGSVQSFSHFC